jgi:hypothetical protein
MNNKGKKMEEEQSPYLYMNCYEDEHYKDMPLCVVDGTKWEFVMSHPIKESEGWFAKTIGRSSVYRRIEFKQMPGIQIPGNLTEIKTNDPNTVHYSMPGFDVVITGSEPTPKVKRKCVKNKLHKRKKYVRRKRGE